MPRRISGSSSSSRNIAAGLSSSLTGVDDDSATLSSQSQNELDASTQISDSRCMYRPDHTQQETKQASELKYVNTSVCTFRVQYNTIQYKNL